MKSICIRSYTGPHFLEFGLNAEILHISPYSVRMWKNADQTNSEYGHFLHSDTLSIPKQLMLTCHCLLPRYHHLNPPQWHENLAMSMSAVTKKINEIENRSEEDFLR